MWREEAKTAVKPGGNSGTCQLHTKLFSSILVKKNELNPWHSCANVLYLLRIMFDRDETELIGQDGHIYKGRFEGLDRMPDLPPVRGFHLKFCFCLYLVSLSLSHFLFVLHFLPFFI